MGFGDYPQARGELRGRARDRARADLQWHSPAPRARLCARVPGDTAPPGRPEPNDALARALKQTRYQLMAYEVLTSLLLDVELKQQALGVLERGLALADAARSTFWRVRSEATTRSPACGSGISRSGAR